MIEGFENHETLEIALLLKNDSDFFQYRKEHIKTVHDLESYCRHSLTYLSFSLAPKRFKTMASFLNSYLENFLDEVNYQEVFDFLNQE